MHRLRAKDLKSLTVVVMCAFSCMVHADNGKTSAVNGDIVINIDAKNIGNILRNTNESQAGIGIGKIRKSVVKGKTKSDISLGDVKNNLDNAHNSGSSIEIGALENAVVNSFSMTIEAKNINSIISGGKNNHARTIIGSIQSATVGNVNADIRIEKNVTNSIAQGTGNTSEITIGSISGQSEQPAAINTDGATKDVITPLNPLLNFLGNNKPGIDSQNPFSVPGKENGVQVAGKGKFLDLFKKKKIKEPPKNKANEPSSNKKTHKKLTPEQKSKVAEFVMAAAGVIADIISAYHGNPSKANAEDILRKKYTTEKQSTQSQRGSQRRAPYDNQPPKDPEGKGGGDPRKTTNDKELYKGKGPAYKLRFRR